MLKSQCFVMAAIAVVSAANAGVVAKTFVNFDSRVSVLGSISAGTNLAIKDNGYLSELATACQEMSIGHRLVQNGLLSATLSRAGELSGPAWQQVMDCQVPNFTVPVPTPGTAPLTLRNEESVSILPGLRGDVVVNHRATLVFKAGQHVLKSLTATDDAVLLLEAGASVQVAQNVVLGNRVKLTSAQAGVVFTVAGNLQASEDVITSISLLVGGNITMGNRPVTSCMTANSVSLGTDAKVNCASAVVLADNFNAEANGFALAAPAALTNWAIPNGSIDVIGVGSFEQLLPAAQVRYIDLNGSTQVAGTITTKTQFPAGRYKVTYKLAGSQRPGSPLAKATMKFGTAFSSVHQLAMNQPLQQFSEEVTIASPMNLSFIGGTLNQNSNTGLILDDVIVSRLP